MPDVLGPGVAGSINTVTTTTDVQFPASGDTFFQDCVNQDPTTGTNIVADFLNVLLQQFRRIIRNSGTVDTSNGDDLLGQALQTGAMNWAGTFGGTANVLTATLTPSPTLLIPGLRVKGLISTVSTTTTPTLNVNGLGPQPIVQPSGSPVAIGAVAVYGEFIWNGTAWEMTVAPAQVARGGVINTQVFSTPGTFTYTPTVGTSKIQVTVLAGGAGGGGSVAMTGSSFQAAGGGGAGGVAISNIASGFAGVTITVGAGGPGGGSPGNTGGSSSFGSFLSATGGIGGQAAVNGFPGGLQAGGPGGSGSGGNVFNGVGGFGAFGSASGPSNMVSGIGGASYVGAGGGSIASMTAPGLAATSKGSGGGGAAGSTSGASQNGGAGAGGEVIIVEYA
jgi:hypothetical protein